MYLLFGGVMGSFLNFFGRKRSSNSPKEYNEAVACNQLIESLLSLDSFIARSDYVHIVEEYKNVYIFFESTQKANTLSYYCKKNKLQESVIKKFLQYYEDIKDLAKGSNIFAEHNESFVNHYLISEKTYLDRILCEIDPNILLDEDQRMVVLSDEDYTLIIAGAGAGKTTTIAAKVRYLVEKKHVDPEQILVVSFTNKAVGELKERINEELLIPCHITTFHSVGYTILRNQDDVKKKIAGEGFLYNCVNDYLKGKILTQPELVDKLVMFFGWYFDAPYEGDDINMFFNYIAKADFTTMKSNVNEYAAQIIDKRTNKVTTITNEVLRSVQEVKIANFLYLNQIVK